MIKSNHPYRPAQVSCLCALLLLIAQSAFADKAITVKTNRSGYNINFQPLNLFKKNTGTAPQSRDAALPASAQPQVRSLSIDPRWREWHSNAVLLLDSAQRASGTNDLVERDRNLAKFYYAKAIAKSEELKLASDGRQAKKVEELETKRAKLVEQRAAQEKFQNTEAVAKLDAQIQEIDQGLQQPESVSPSSELVAPRQPVNLLAKELSEARLGDDLVTVCSAVFRVAHNMEHTGGRISAGREQLAAWANRPGTSQEVLNKALALNSQLKQVQDDLAAGRLRRAQDTATVLWNSFLD